MILDQLSNLSTNVYTGLLTSQANSASLAGRLMAGLRYLQTADLANIGPSVVEIDGRRVYAMHQEYNTKPREKGFWEAHRKYIDIQYVVAGSERMGYANLAHLTQGEFDESKDFLPLYGEGNFFVMHAGSFVILAPEDAHMPQIAVDAPMPVKKVVIKVAVADE